MSTNNGKIDNKYQEALDQTFNQGCRLCQDKDKCHLCKAHELKETLQELIDNYLKLEKTLDIAIERLSNNYEILSGNKEALKSMIRKSLFEESEKL